jgi:hypothetical protein
MIRNSGKLHSILFPSLHQGMSKTSKGLVSEKCMNISWSMPSIQTGCWSRTHVIFYEKHFTPGFIHHFAAFLRDGLRGKTSIGGESSILTDKAEAEGLPGN